MKGNCAKLERYNGTTWDLVAKRVSLTDPELTRETIEQEDILDCDSSGGSSTKKKSPGTKEIGDFEVELIWNPVVDDPDADPDAIVNADKHHLFQDDYDTETATFWRIVHDDTEATGIIVHATVKTIGAATYQPNQTVKKTITMEPTGEHFERANDVTNVILPSGIAAPSDYWGS